MSYFDRLKDISVLVGKTISDIQSSEDEVIFSCEDGKRYKMYHTQDCCEDVTVEDICGDLQDIIGSEVITAFESSNSNDTDWGSETWTFYKIDTTKGGVTIRWHGESNGYYSEDVDFEELG